MQLKQEILINVDEAQEEYIPIFKKSVPGSESPDPIYAFEQLLKNKPIGSWLIRESRAEGMISLTRKLTNGSISHTRFAFVDGTWVVVGNNKLKKHKEREDVINYNCFDVSTVRSKLDLLFEVIHQVHPLLDEKMIKPSFVQATEQAGYYIGSLGYQLSKVRSNDQVIYAELLNSLEQVQTVMKNLRSALNEHKTLLLDQLSLLEPIKLEVSRAQLSKILRETNKPFKHSEFARKIKDLFEEWLDVNKLTADLLCPISQSLFAEPYYVVESGMVFDVDSLFPADKCLSTCPLTRKPIEFHPVHFSGYRKKLYECLEQFFDLLELYQEKQQLANQQQGSGNHLSPSFFMAKPIDEKEDAMANQVDRSNCFSG